MKKKLKLFQRMETLKKKDILKDKHHSMLIEQEITKTKSLLHHECTVHFIPVIILLSLTI